MVTNISKTPTLKNIVNELNNKVEIREECFNGELVDTNIMELAKLERFKKDTDLKTKLAIFVIRFTSIWSGAIILLLYSAAFGFCHLSDAVINVLISETIVTVIALPWIACRHFFPTK